MTPRETTYRLASSPADYRACHALLRSQDRTGPDMFRLTFPTVTAWRKGKLVGFLTTEPRPAEVGVTAGQLGNATGSFILTIRLLEAYERVLNRAGVSRYSLFLRRGNPLLAVAERLGFAAWQDDPDGIGTWFRKEVARG